MFKTHSMVFFRKTSVSRFHHVGRQNGATAYLIFFKFVHEIACWTEHYGLNERVFHFFEDHTPLRNHFGSKPFWLKGSDRFWYPLFLLTLLVRCSANMAIRQTKLAAVWSFLSALQDQIDGEIVETKGVDIRCGSQALGHDFGLDDSPVDLVLERLLVVM